MRRTITGLTAFLAFTGTVLVIPVYAAPVPKAHPVKPSVSQVAMGSVTQPAADAVVTADGQPLAGGVSQAEATGEASLPASSASSSPSTSPTPSAPDASGTSATPSTGPATSTPPAPSSAAGSPAPGDVARSGRELRGIPALTVSKPHTKKFSTVGVTWQQDNVENVVVQLRVRKENGRWGNWDTLQPDDVQGAASAAHTSGIRGGTVPYFTGDAYGVQAIVQGAGGVVPKDVKVTLIDPGTSDADKLEAAPAGTAHAAEAMPAVYSRAQWGADESIRTWDPEYAPTIKAAALHHTDDTNNYTADQVPGMIRSIYYFHAVTRGWGDIGYNVLVDKFGRLFEGRYGGLGSTVIGAHTGGFNYDTFGISMIGNYDQVPVPAATVEAVSQFIAWKFGQYGVSANTWVTLNSAGGGTDKFAAGVPVSLPTIFGHRDTGNTVCPGQYGYAQLPAIRNRVAQLAPLYAKVTTVVRNGTTGNIPDVSPVYVSAATPPSGLSTVFVRGLNNTAWYRTAKSGGGYGAWTLIPDTGATTGPAVTLSDETHLDLVVRGTDFAVWYNSTTLKADGTPGTWQGWRSLGGYATAAPTIASMGAGKLAVVTRGLDGAVWQRVLSGGSWSDWTSLAGYAWSAPEIQADTANSRYLVSVIGTDNTVWQVGAGVDTPGPRGPWVGGALYSSHTPGTNGDSAAVGPATLLSLGGAEHQLVVMNTAGATIDLGGTVTSIAGMTLLPDGSSLIFGRGTDDSLWSLHYQAGQKSTWTPLGGTVQ